MYQNVPTYCPICCGILKPDIEYMLKTYGPAFEYMPWTEWSFYCDGTCGEAGPWSDFVKNLETEDFEASNAHAVHKALRMAYVTIQCEHGHLFDVLVPQNTELTEVDCPICSR